MPGAGLCDPDPEPAHTRVRIDLGRGRRLAIVYPRRFGTGELLLGEQALEEFFAATGMFGGGIGPVSSVAYEGTEGELYDVEGDPHQWENRWDDTARQAMREELIAALYESLPSDRQVLKVEPPA